MGGTTRLLTMLAATGLSIAALGACGDSDDGGETPTSQVQATTTEQQGTSRQEQDQEPEVEQEKPEPQTTPDAADDGPGEQAGGEPSESPADVVEEMYESFGDADAAGVCATLSEAVREQVAQNVIGGSTQPPAQRTCEKSFGKFLSAAASSGLLAQAGQARVGDIRVDGTTAIATVTIGGRSGKLRLVQEDQRWRVGATPVPGSQDP